MSDAQIVYRFVNRRIHQLWDAPEQWRKATLAKLRGGIGKTLDETPDIWDIVLLDGTFVDAADLRGERQDRRQDRVEQAIHTALTLYALHSQSKDANVSEQGISFGAAVALLKLRKPDAEEAIKRRFDAAITCKDVTEFAHHARGIIQLLRADEIKLDYPQFAQDYYQLRWIDSQKSILLKWGRDFYGLNRFVQNNSQTPSDKATTDNTMADKAKVGNPENEGEED